MIVSNSVKCCRLRLANNAFDEGGERRVSSGTVSSHFNIFYRHITATPATDVLRLDILYECMCRYLVLLPTYSLVLLIQDLSNRLKIRRRHTKN